ncbi:MAG: ArsR family transcriptional regulator [Dehalococcoidia bacterium]
MKGTRAQILDLLRRGEMTVAELSEALDIAAPALRRHLDILTGEGMVEYRSVKQQTGRPYFAYRLTERAQEAGATGYARLLERMLVEAAALPAGESGGRVLLEALLDRLSASLTDDYRARVRGATLEERVRSLTEALRAEGIVEAWEQRDDGIHLFTNLCPHRRAALVAHELCDSERQVIANLLGANVEQVGRMVDGAACCEYVVRPRTNHDLLPVLPITGA